MNMDQAAFRDIINAKSERQVANRLNYYSATAIEEIFVYSVQQTAHSLDSRKHLTSNGFIDVSISQIIERGQSDFYSDTRLSGLYDSTFFRNFFIRGAPTQRSAISPVSQIVRYTVHARVQVPTVQVRFQKTVGLPYDDQKYEIGIVTVSA